METKHKPENLPSNDSWQETTQSHAKMINDLWGVMMALFGSKWTSQFGEKTDPSGQWSQTLMGVTRKQVSEALEVIRDSGRIWPPTAPEFKAMCAAGLRPELRSVDSALAEFNRFLCGGVEMSDLSPAVYHTVKANANLGVLRQLPYDKCAQEFRSAYRATLEDYRLGEKILSPPAPETLIEGTKETEMTPEERAENERKGEEVMKNLLGMFKGGDNE